MQLLLTNAVIASEGGGTTGPSTLAVEDRIIEWCGPSHDLPDRFMDWPSEDLGGRLLTPGFIDCHTHLVHAGNRSREFAMRLDGASYSEIAHAGGGIVSTVAATRAASEDDLVALALPRLDALIAEGVTTIEIKSGYGLEIETELRMLRAARRLEKDRKVRVKTSWLAAHAVPIEYSGRSQKYLTEVCLRGLEIALEEGLVDAVDGFCESIGFSPEEIEMVFQHASKLGLPVKLHAEQLSYSGGAALAARYHALSADHLEYLRAKDAEAFAASGTVAVILPGAYYTLRETSAPPIDAFRSYGVPMAVATDLNPGSSPLNSLLLATNMACTLFRLTTAEALNGVTVHAARALGLDDSGTLTPGARADLAVWDVSSPAELPYRIGFNPLYARYFAGERT